MTMLLWGGSWGGLVSIKLLMLLQVVCENFLKRIQLADFDPFAASLLQRDNKLPLQLLWRTLRKSY